MAPVSLPCGHAYCGACLAELRAKKVAQTCPLCRAELPPDVGMLSELACRTLERVGGMVQRGEVSWTSLAAELKEMDEAIEMLTEAGAQGNAEASFGLWVRRLAARYADSHYNLGVLLRDVLKDFDGAKAAYRAAIAADPGHANAHNNLGILLETVRKDFDGAAAAYRAAIAADPGHVRAHKNLGKLLSNRAGDLADRAWPNESTGDLAAAAAMWDEVASHFEVAYGVFSQRRAEAVQEAVWLRAVVRNGQAQAGPPRAC